MRFARRLPRSSEYAISSGVLFFLFRFIVVFLFEQLDGASDAAADVEQHFHDKRGISRGERARHDLMVAFANLARKMALPGLS